MYRAVLSTKGGWGGSRGGESSANPELLGRSLGDVDECYTASCSSRGMAWLHCQGYQPITFDHEISPTKYLSALTS